MADPITNEQLAGKVVEAVTAVQNAEETVVAEGKRLTAHMADPNAHGQDVGACIAQAVADHEGNADAHMTAFTALKTTLETQIAAKASMADVEDALTKGLAGKAEQSAMDVAFAAVNVELASKMDSVEVTAALAAKADLSALEDLAQRVDQSWVASMDVPRVFYLANTGGF